MINDVLQQSIFRIKLKKHARARAQRYKPAVHEILPFMFIGVPTKYLYSFQIPEKFEECIDLTMIYTYSRGKPFFGSHTIRDKVLARGIISHDIVCHVR